MEKKLHQERNKLKLRRNLHNWIKDDGLAYLCLCVCTTIAY